VGKIASKVAVTLSRISGGKVSEKVEGVIFRDSAPICSLIAISMARSVAG
jgi:hypothetical protein